VKIYFADPHSPWQRGSNENTNGLLRQYFPKGIDLNTVTDQQFHDAVDELNNRPRLVLGDRIPAQLLRWLRPPIRDVR
jgi:IS30 family transposase